MSSCLGRAKVPVKRVGLGLGARLGLRVRRTTGLGELRREVRTCEYRDVHVMWELLDGMDGGAELRHNMASVPSTAGKKQTRRRRTKKAGAGAAAWSRLFSSCCAF